MALFSRIFGDPNTKTLNSLKSLVQQTAEFEKNWSKVQDGKLAERIQDIRKELEGKTIQDTDQYLPEVFSIVREASKRTIGLRHFDEQILGGIVLHQGKITEMKTGEGKTLVATLPVTLNALLGKGVHIVTVNDYLAKRDTIWMGAIYHLLGITVGCIQHDEAFIYEANPNLNEQTKNNLKKVNRREAYFADITYGTNNEFGFDYLRDNMAPELTLKVQRGMHYAIVDEVDSILIDEARTPLIISAPAEESTDQYYKFAELVKQLIEDEDYNVDEKMRAATLTESGITRMEKALSIDNIYQAGGVETIHHIEQALKAHALFTKDKEYVVKDGEVIIVDEFTGRLMNGRRFSEGLHQAIEAKEKVNINKESETLATISFQNYFRIYKKLAGMTGTAVTEAEEFSKIYGLEVVIIPTHRPLIRKDLQDSIYKTEKGKFMAVAREIKRRHELGQPVLVGTISIDKNEILSELLEREGIPHELLNAKNHEREAAIIEQAGKKGAVTVATNMAGRGVDIVFGGNPPDKQEAELVRSLGGLHVIGTERHESRRIDNQLRGRSGRQGDPGSTQFFVCMDDDLMRIFGSDRMKSVMDRLGVPDDMPIENGLISKSIESAQKKVEGHNFDIRKHLVEYDDVMNKHREVIYRIRNEILESSDDRRKQKMFEIIGQEIGNVVSFHTANENERTWDIEEIYQVTDTIFPVGIEQRIKLDDLRGLAGDISQDVAAREAIIQYLVEMAKRAYDNIEKRLTSQTMRKVELGISLRSIDRLWIEHLDMMGHLRQGIGLRGYGQRDPLVEYKKEAYGMFTQLINSINSNIVYSLFRMGLAKNIAETNMAKQRQTINVSTTSQSQFSQSNQSSTLPSVKTEGQSQTIENQKKIGRNDPCPCGSGKKYKKCHGA